MPDVYFSDISPGAKTVHTLIILTVSFFMILEMKNMS